MMDDEKRKKTASTASEMDGLFDASDLIKDGKNGKSIVCKRCSSIILKPNCAVRVTEKEKFLPFMHKKSEHQNPESGETVNNYWLVDNMFTFENVGFSNTVGTTKYLICADCEIGPIGWHDVTDNTAFFVSIERVNHS